MNFAAQSFAGRRDAITFLVCLLLAVVARADPLGISASVASGLRESVLVPFLYLQYQTQLVRDRRAEFDHVVNERDSLTMIANDLDMVRADNVQLRAMLGLAQKLRFDYVAAEVLHQVGRSEMSTLVISAGARHGVKLWAPVISPNGLVGYVFRVDRLTSMVYAWTDGQFRASASTVDGSTSGLVAPRSGIGPVTAMELREVAHLADLRAGTPIVTTGLGGVYPRGLLIGFAGQLVEEQEGLSKTYQLNPAVYPAEVAHVLVLLHDSTIAVDLTPLYVDSLR